MNKIKQREKALFLIGGRACGKTTIGTMLADALGIPFLDMDKIIEEEEGKKIQELVATGGWASFREKENELLKRLARADACVIATGGGAILHQDIWPSIKERGLVVWLKAGTETMRARLKADHLTPSQRPSLTGKDVLSEAEGIMKEREPLYRSGSHLQIDTEYPVERVLDLILQAYKQEK